MAGHVRINVSLVAVRSMDTLIILREMSDTSFSQAMKEGESMDQAFSWLAIGFSSSWFMGVSIFDDYQLANSARSGSAILNDLIDSFYTIFIKSLGKVCHNHSPLCLYVEVLVMSLNCW